MLGLAIIIIMVFVALFSAFIAPQDFDRINARNRLKAPDRTNWFGTDCFGRDIFGWVIVGSKATLAVGVAVALFSTLFGVLFGVIAGYYRKLDKLIMRFMDGLSAFPPILLAIALLAFWGRGLSSVVLALSIVYTPRITKVARGEVLLVREMEYVQAAQALGSRDIRILSKHVAPNILSPIIVQSTFNFASAILTETGLSYLGIGIPPYLPSWGGLLSEGQPYLTNAPWIAIFPGLAIMLIVLGLNLFGDGIRDILDPKMRQIIN